MIPNLFESFCIRQALVLVGQIQAWRESSPDASFEQILVQNCQAISEEDWMREVAGVPTAPTIYPVQLGTQIAPSSCTRHGRQLLEKHHAIILQDDPVLVVGILNPYSQASVREALSLYFPGRFNALVCLTPHGFVRLAALLERDAADFKPDWGCSLDSWCQALGLDSVLFEDINALVEDLWSDAFPIIPPYQIEEVAPIPKVDDALVLAHTGLHIWVVTPNPRDVALRERLLQETGRMPFLFGVSPAEFERLQHLLNSRCSPVSVSKESPLHIQSWGNYTGNDLLMNIVKAAIQMGSSDIHLDPKDERLRVRFRVDGDLFEQAPVGYGHVTELMRAIKIHGHMLQDVEGRIQDGAGWVCVKNVRYDLRYAIAVTNGGYDAVVCRIFSSKIPDMGTLGFSIQETKTLKWFLQQESGMVVLCGPTGSGKTTTLYSLLNEIDDPSLDIVTIEQPVEKYYPNAKQINVREDGNLTFTTALRSILRHDPDVILIGEIRDDEGCNKAVEAALTGHLVLTTTHANDAVGVIERLATSFKADRSTLADALKLAIAQRLVPRLCRFCKVLRDVEPEDVEYFPSLPIARPVIAERRGCSACRGTGYIGRSVIMEMLPVNEDVRAMLAAGRQSYEITKYIRDRGYLGITEQATRLLLTGEISVETAKLFIRKPLN